MVQEGSIFYTTSDTETIVKLIAKSKRVKTIDKIIINKTKLKNIHINANNYEKVDRNGIPKVIEMTLINPKKFKIKSHKTKIIFFTF